MTAPRISFEFFPPQNMDATFRLADTVRELAPFNPEFVSVTYGAGGTTRELTHDAVISIHKRYDFDLAAHLTCVSATREETLAIANQYADEGVNQIVALRGDPPKGSTGFEAYQGGFATSIELVEALAATGRFNIRVGAYPDRHPEAADDMADVTWLKRKMDAGASSAITQFFFEADTYFRFRDKCVAAGIDAPIIPGILPIQSFKGVKNFAARCGTTVPAWLEEAYAKAGKEGHDALSVDIASKLCETLMEGGVEDFQFYTLNKTDITRDVLRNLGVSDKAQTKAA